MNRALQRLLRIRMLLERRSLAELEKENAELHRLEGEAERQRSVAATSRSGALRRLAAAADETWLLDIADADLFACRRTRFEEQAARCRSGADAAREELLGRRRERRQVETLLAAAAAAEKADGVRREQRSVDDWFQSRRFSRQKESDPQPPS